MRSLKDLMDLRGRVVLVTGGAGHIGAAMGEALAELGARVVVADLQEQACVRVAVALQATHGVEALPLAADLADETSSRRLVARVVERMGRLDILVHGAAWVGTTQSPGWAVPFPEQTVGAWESALRVNLTAAFVLAQEAATALAASGKGSLILIGSIYGMVGPDLRLYDGTSMAHPAAYGASKGGLLQFTRYLATVLAPRVRVNAISPGGVWRNQPEPFHERYRQRTPLGRMATEEDIKGAVAYLASDLSEYVTGHNLVVDGGWTAW